MNLARSRSHPQLKYFSKTPALTRGKGKSAWTDLAALWFGLFQYPGILFRKIYYSSAAESHHSGIEDPTFPTPDWYVSFLHLHRLLLSVPRTSGTRRLVRYGCTWSNSESSEAGSCRAVLLDASGNDDHYVGAFCQRRVRLAAALLDRLIHHNQ